MQKQHKQLLIFSPWILFLGLCCIRGWDDITNTEMIFRSIGIILCTIPVGIWYYSHHKNMWILLVVGFVGIIFSMAVCRIFFSENEIPIVSILFVVLALLFFIQHYYLRTKGELSAEITELLSFLEKEGFTLYHKQGPDRMAFGNIYMEYGNGSVKVQIVLDRSQWLLAMADMTQPDNWYDTNILRNFILGTGRDNISVSEQVRIIETAWQDMMNAFSPSRRQATHACLDQLRKERAMRIFSSWSDAALDLEAFLSKEGLDCQQREAPEGFLGEKLMQYSDAVIGVRITCGSPQDSRGWHVEVADAAHPENWYDIALIRCLTEGTNDTKMPYLRRFEFVKENWEQIRQLFCNSCRETTHERLKQLLAEERGHE